MNQENYPNCRTCKHLQTDEQDSVCREIEGPNCEIAWLEGSNYDADLLYVNPDKFGCILHEPLTTSSQ